MERADGIRRLGYLRQERRQVPQQHLHVRRRLEGKKQKER
jgi:hypothetical protein